MLKLKYLFENFDLAKKCMEFYECDMASVDEMLQYFRISSNAIYPFRSKTGGRICFLRLSPTEEKKLDDVKSEIRLMEWLIDEGISIFRRKA